MKGRSIRLFIYISIFILVLSGCSRRSINRQIAESIGTLGMYEDDEPVESPKMKAEKQMKETKDKIEETVTRHIDQAQKLADQYDYYGALEELAQIEEDYQDDKRIIDDKIRYTKLCDTLVYHSGSIPHFSVGNLVVDRDRAYKDPEMGSELNRWTLTVDEFRKILQKLYDNDYVLVDIQDIVEESTDEKNHYTMLGGGLLIPEKKKPIILSFTGAGYEKQYYSLGFSNRMVIDKDGRIRNEYTDANGKTAVGAYDVVPVLDEFLEKNPGFSLRGAKGILGITGFKGAFGYSDQTDGETIEKIAEQLKGQGWHIACQGYRGMSMESELDADGFVEDLQSWIDRIGKYVGETELLIFPNGEEVPLYAFKHIWALEHGFHFFFTQWATADTLTIYDDCLFQSRRPLNGYDLYFYGEDMEQFFKARQILDKSRPEFE